MSAGGAIVLAGFMGAGKTTAARDLAAMRGLRAHDVDHLIEAQAGAAVPEIFRRDGEPAFRALEETVVCGLLREVGPGDVVSLSGGAVGSAAVRDALAHHLVVWLDIEPALAWRRVAGGRRPLARDRASFERLHAERRATYAAIADSIIPCAAREAMMAFVLADAYRSKFGGDHIDDVRAAVAAYRERIG